MIAAVLEWLAPLVVPEGVGAEALLAAGLLAVVLALGAVLRVVTTRVPAPMAAAAGFAELRVRLRASDPDAAGHHRARAPGSTR